MNYKSDKKFILGMKLVLVFIITVLFIGISFGCTYLFWLAKNKVFEEVYEKWKLIPFLALE